MDAGRQRQIEQGRCQQHLPTGLVRLEDGRVSKTSDLQVQRTLNLVFARFTALGSCQKVLRSLRDDGMLLPRKPHGGLFAGQLVWRKPTQAAASAPSCIILLMREPSSTDVKGLIPTDDPDSCARSGIRWKRGQPSTRECILHISVGTSFWPIKRDWQTMPAILRVEPMGLHDKAVRS
jgi:hypothetical protein